MASYYVGLAATLHDPAVAIVDSTGRPLFAEAVERYLQNKRAFNAPPDDLLRLPNLLRCYCTDPDPQFVAAISWSAPYLHRLELFSAAFAAPPRRSVVTSDLAWPGLEPSAITLSLRNSLSQAGLNLAASWRTPGPVVVRRYDHHLTHAATAAFTSPYEECVVAVVDGSGEDGSTACYRVSHGQFTRLDSPSMAPSLVPASLGHFYALVCAGCGFDPWRGEEWKVMGLAAYGSLDTGLYRLLRPLLTVDGLSLKSDCSIEDYEARAAALRARGRQVVRPEDAADLACTGQQIFEEVMTELLSNLHDQHPSPVLALGGGCALNSSFNGKIIERTGFERVHVPPAPADDGTALGAAFLARREEQGNSAPLASAASPYLGSSISDDAVCRLRAYSGITHHTPGRSVATVTAQALSDGLIVGWIQGRAEFGPRALGNRSILADPRSADMRARINNQVKFRELFRPLAPSILDEHGDAWFENYQTSPYMDRALRFRSEQAARVPAVVHTDGTGRVHSVCLESNPLFHALVSAFHARTGVPMVLNTSFNVMGKPIVHSIEDAVAVFLTSDLDWLVVGGEVWQKPRCAVAHRLDT